MNAMMLPLLGAALLGSGSVDGLPSPSLSIPINPTSKAPAVRSAEELIARVRGVNAVECQDRIHRARAAAGLPLLKREPASPDKPHLIYAVDRRQDGCGVMVMMGNPDDIRPLPEPFEDQGRGLLIPAGDQN